MEPCETTYRPVWRLPPMVPRRKPVPAVMDALRAELEAREWDRRRAAHGDDQADGVVAELVEVSPRAD